MLLPDRAKPELVEPFLRVAESVPHSLVVRAEQADFPHCGVVLIHHCVPAGDEMCLVPVEATIERKGERQVVVRILFEGAALRTKRDDQDSAEQNAAGSCPRKSHGLTPPRFWMSIAGGDHKKS